MDYGCGNTSQMNSSLPHFTFGHSVYCSNITLTKTLAYPVIMRGATERLGGSYKFKRKIRWTARKGACQQAWLLKLGPIPRTHVVEGENWLSKKLSWLRHTHTHKCKQCWRKFFFKFYINLYPSGRRQPVSVIRVKDLGHLHVLSFLIVLPTQHHFL